MLALFKKSKCTLLASIVVPATFLSFASVQQALADRFEVDRSRAKAALVDGRVAVGITQLHKLAEDGDPKSAYLLGRLFLKNKIKSLAVDQKKSLRYFELAAEKCHEPSVAYLTEVFYNRRGSEYFAPYKAERLDNRCADGNSLSAEPLTLPFDADPAKVEDNAQTQANDNTPAHNDLSDWEAIAPPAFTPTAGGSGVAINDSGLFLTNHHVIDNCKNVAIEYNGQLGKGRVVRFDQKLDVALVRVSASTPFFSSFDASPAQAGETLIAIGYPVSALFGRSPTVSEGKLTNASDEQSYVNKGGFLLTSIPIASGNSGGPVYTRTGGLRGIVSYTVRQENIEEIFRELGYDEGPLLSNNTTFNFIVSGPRIVKWLEYTKFKFSQKNSQKLLDSEVVSKLGIKALADVICYK
jgi:S1-C subfamily serine protease